ncbi:MAG: CPXCG motif-containing cysteine-rich protein [Gammaproteobacteria bacterium]
MKDLDERVIHCPYCGEFLDVLVDPSSDSQRYYEDCAVCCSPILFILSENESGEMVLDVRRDDE